MRKIDRDAMLEDLDEMKQIDFLELIREAAAEAAGSSPVKVWDVRTQKSTIYRHVAIYVLHQFGFEAKRIGAFLQFQRQTVVEIVRDFQRGLDSEDAAEAERHQAALHGITAAINRLRQGIRK